MAIVVNCYRCRQELNEPGAVILPPPTTDLGVIGDIYTAMEVAVVGKVHLCRECWRALTQLRDFWDEHISASLRTGME